MLDIRCKTKKVLLKRLVVLYTVGFAMEIDMSDGNKKVSVA
jgi:hypothetical protein